MLVSDNPVAYAKAINTARRYIPNTKSTPISLIYLECLHFIQTGELDKLEMRVQLLSRKLKGVTETRRWKTILKVLNDVIEKSGNYHDLEENTFISLYFLVKEPKSYNWNCLGEEVIHFGSFFEDIYYANTKNNLDAKLASLRQKVKNSS